MLSRGKKQRHIKAWLIAVMATLILLPLVIEYFSILQLLAYYRFWSVLLMAVVIIFTSRWRKAPPAERYPARWVMWLLMLLALILVLCSLLYYSPWLLVCAWGGVLAWGALYLSSYRKVENLLGIWLLSLLWIRPPYEMTLRIIRWIENVSIEAASFILDYLSVLHSVQGGVVSLPDYNFAIEGICSGWVSVTSAVVLAAILCVVRNRKFLHSVSLLLMAVMCSWILNVLRTVMVVCVHLRFDTDLLAERYLPVYESLSLVVALVLVGSADAFLTFLLGAITTKERGGREARSHKRLLLTLWRFACEFKLSDVLGRFSSPSKMKPMSGVMTGIVFLGLSGLIGLEAVVLYHRPQITQRKFMYGEDKLSQIGQNSVVFDRAGWEVIEYREEKREFSSIWGSHSNIWFVEYHGVVMVMALDFPFDDWHDVKACYGNIGWRIEGETIIDTLPSYQWEASQTDMILPSRARAFILCSHYDHLGNTVQPKPAEHGWKMTLYRLHPRQMTPPFGYRDKNLGTFYQTQCMVTTQMPLDELTKEEIRMMYARFREQTRVAIMLRSRQNQNR